MLKKTLTAGLAAIMMLSMTACGGSKEQEVSKMENVQNENVQNENVQNENAQNENVPDGNAPAQTAAADDMDEMSYDEICQAYFDYRTGVTAEEDFEDYMQDINMTLDEIEAVFEQHGGYLKNELAMIEADSPVGIPHFDATDEIKNASMQQFKFQTADMVFTSFSRITDCLEQIDNSTLPFTYDYNPDKLMTICSRTEMEVYLNNELYMTLGIGNPRREHDDENTRPLKECIVYHIELEDYSNVYYAGGIPAMDSGLSVAEYDELMQKDLNSLIESNYVTRTDRVYGDPDHYHVYYDFDLHFGENLVLECDNASQLCAYYTYQGTFDEAGTRLETLILDYENINYWDFEIYGLSDSDTVLER